MVKLKLLGSGKSEKHNYYIFPKTQNFFSLIRNLLKELGFENEKYEDFGRPVDRYSEPIFDKEENINEFTDTNQSFENKEYFIEIIFGKDKIFLTIHTEKDRQQKIAKLLSKLITE